MFFETIKPGNKRFPNYVRVVLAEVPENAPQEVKEIVNKHSVDFGTGSINDPTISFTDKRFDKKIYTKKILQLGEELQSKGYNPSDYGINMERLNNELQLRKAKAQYNKLIKQMENLQYKENKLSGIRRKFFNPFKQELQLLSEQIAKVTETIESNPINKNIKENIEKLAVQMKKSGLGHLIGK